MSKKTISSFVLLAIIIMFSFPWITISCAGQPLISATGFQLTNGNYRSIITSEVRDDLGIPTSEVPKSAPNISLILVLILSGIGIVSGLTKREKVAHKISAWLSSIIFVILIGFWIGTPRAFYSSMTGEPSVSSLGIAEIRQLIQLHFRPAFYFAIILAAGCVFLNFYAMSGLKERKLPIGASNQPTGSVSDESDFIFCPNCGARNPINNKYCSKCGAKLPERR